MANVGFATVTLAPSFKGFQRKAAAGIPSAAKPAEKWSNGFARTAGAKLKGGLTKAFKVGVTGAIAGGGFAAFKGWDRLLNIEDAQAKLKGLGYSIEEIEKVTQNALAAVEGTPYALDEAMTVAGGLLASGVESGEELEKILGLVADSATIAGVSVGEMGGVWNKIFAGGLVQAEEMNQLADRGIPIFQLLADHMGVSVSEVKKLGSEGKISAQDFAVAMEKYSGAAKSAGDTTRGAVANAVTAIAKLGADALEPIQPLVKNAADRIKTEVADIQPAVKETSATLTGSLVEAFGQVDRSSRDTSRSLSGVAGVFRDEFAGVFTQTNLNATVQRLVDLLDDVASAGLDIAYGWAPVVADAGKIVAVLGGGLLGVLEELVPAAGRLGEAMGEALEPFTGVALEGVKAATGLMVEFAGAAAGVVDWAAELPGPVLAAGGAFLMLRGHIGDGQKAVESFRGALDTLKLRRHLAQMEGLSGGAALAQGAMTRLGGAVRAAGSALKTAFISNGPLLAISALAGVVGHFALKSQEAKQRQDELGQTLDQVTGKVSDQTFEWIRNDDAVRKGADAYVEAGGKAEDYYGHIMGNKDATAEYNKVLEETAGKFNENTQAADTWGRKGTTEASRAKIAYEEFTGAADDAIDVIAQEGDEIRETNRIKAEATGATEEMTRATEDYVSSVEDVIDAERRRKGETMTMAEAQIAHSQSIEAMTRALEDESKAFNAATGEWDAYTSAGQTAIGATEQHRQAMWDMAEAMEMQGASADEITGKLTEMNSGWVDQAAKMTGSRESAEKLIETYGLIPDDIVTLVTADADAAVLTIEGVGQLIANTDGTITLNGEPLPAYTTLGELVGDVDEASGTVDFNGERLPADLTLKDLLAHINSSSATTTVDANTSPGKTNVDRLHYEASKHQTLTVGANTASASASIGALDGSSVTVNVRAAVGGAAAAIQRLNSADGNIFDFYRDGGLRENHVAHIAPAGAWRVFAEPETGGEAYIPLALRKRHRSTRLLAEVADRFGYRLLPSQALQFEDGGTFNAGRSGLTGVTINMESTINNPVEEASSVSINKRLQDAALLVGGLV